MFSHQNSNFQFQGRKMFICFELGQKRTFTDDLEEEEKASTQRKPGEDHIKGTMTRRGDIRCAVLPVK